MIREDGYEDTMMNQAEAGSILPEDEEALSEEDQESYDTFMEGAHKFMFDEKSGWAEDTAKRLLAAEDRPAELAAVVYDLVAALDERSGGILPDELVGTAAVDIMGDVVEMTGQLGAPMEKPQVATAYKLMVERYISENGGSQEDIAALMSQVDVEGMAAALGGEDGNRIE